MRPHFSRDTTDTRTDTGGFLRHIAQKHPNKLLRHVSQTGFPKTLNPRSPCGFEPGGGGAAKGLFLSQTNAISIAELRGIPRRSQA
jgi:hypothetical protein